MAGLVPAIHVLLDARKRRKMKKTKKDVDARDISAFTRVFDALCAGMTSRESAFVKHDRTADVNYRDKDLVNDTHTRLIKNVPTASVKHASIASMKHRQIKSIQLD